MKTLRVMVCGLLMFSILGCPVLAAAAPMAGEVDPAAVEAMDPNVIAPDEAIVEDAAPAVPDSAPVEENVDQEEALPPAGDQIVDGEPMALEEAMDIPVVAIANTDVMLEIPWNLINACGNQGSTKACQAFCWTYCRIILDKKAYKYTDYIARGNTAKHPSSAKYENLTNASDEQALLKIVYDNINLGRPVVLRVKGDNYPYHYVVVVGYKSSCNVSKLKTSDFYMIDPVNKNIKKSNGSKEAYSLLSNRTLKNYGYSVAKSGGVNVINGGGIQKPNNPTPTYTVTFDPNGGSVNEKTRKVVQGNLIGTLPIPTRSGYTFDYWCDKKEGTGMIVTKDNFDVTKNVTLYARWTKVENKPQTPPTQQKPQTPPVRTEIKFTGLTAPKTLTEGQSFSIDGTITATGSRIYSVKAEVINTSTQKTVLSSISEGRNLEKYGPIAGSKVDKDLKLANLKAGTYYIKYTVKTKDGTTKTAQTGNFTVTKKTEIKFSGLTAPKTLTEGQSYTIDGMITATGSRIYSVKAEIINTSTKKAVLSSISEGRNLEKYGPIAGSKVDKDLKFAKLKPGTYYIKYTVTTKDGTVKTAQTSTFTVKK